MTDHQALIQAWLRGERSAVTRESFAWDPGFDAERSVVLARLALGKRVYEKPVNFKTGFMQKVYGLPIEYWSLAITQRLHGGFCTLTANLEIYFQASIAYAQNNSALLAQLNAHIKHTYEGVINDVVRSELNLLKDGEWVLQGLAATEAKIAQSLNETLLVAGIQARSRCEVLPTFAEYSTDSLDGRIVQDVIYHKVMQKDYEFREKQAQAQYQKAEELERLRLEHAQKQLDIIQQDDEIERKKQALAAELLRQKLLEQAAQRQQQHEVELQLETEKARYEKELKAIELASALEFEEEKQLLEQQLAVQKLDLQLAHEQILKTKRGFEEAAILAQEQKAAQLAEEKALQRQRLDLELKLKEEEAEQLKRQKLAEKLAALKIEHDLKINKMNLDAEVKALEMRAETLKSKDDYLHREIEWLVLDKQRAEMTRSVQDD